MSKTGKRAQTVSRLETVRPHIPNPDNAALAADIKSAFVSARQTLLPNTPGCSAAQDVYFDRAAEICVFYKETAEIFVNTQVGQLLRTGAGLFPQGLASRKVAEAARADRASADEIDLLRYRLQLDRWKRYHSLGSPAGVLRTCGHEFSPLICYALARQYGVDDVAEKCREGARREMAGSRVAPQLFADVEVFK